MRNVRIIRHQFRQTALLFTFALSHSCSNDTAPTHPIEPEATLGSLELTIAETGARPDTDGYEVSITLAQTGPIVMPVEQGTGSVLFPELPAGRHSLTIQGLAAHCSAGSQPRSFLVESGVTTTLRVAVFCPGPGAVLIKTVTRGRDIGVVDYTLSIGGDSTTAVRSIGTIDSLMIGEEDLPPGTNRVVRLNGIPDNCWVDQDQSVTVRPLRGDTRRIEYAVVCIPRSTLMAYEFVNGIYVGRGSDALSLTLGLVSTPSRGPSLSPDRSRVVFSTIGDFFDEGPALIMANADGGGMRWLTSDALVFVGTQAWSPDGSRIVFWKTQGGSSLGDIYVMNADGSGEIRLTHDGMNSSPAWSPDGSSIAFCKAYVFDVIDIYFDIYRMNVDGSAATAVGANGCDPAWSPDGSKIAFTDFSLFQPYPDVAVIRSDGSGHVRLHPGGTTSSSEASEGPTWSPDGSQIAYSGGSRRNRIWLVDFEAGAFGVPFPYRFGRAPSWR